MPNLSTTSTTGAWPPMSSPWLLGLWILGDNPWNYCAFDGKSSLIKFTTDLLLSETSPCEGMHPSKRDIFVNDATLKGLLATRAHRGTGWFGSGAIRAATGRRWLLTFVCLIHGRRFRFLHLTHLITALDRLACVVHFELAAYQEEPRSSANSAANVL